MKGRQDLDALPADFRTFLADTQKALNHSLTVAEAPMAKLGRPLFPHLDYLDSREECAHAFESEGYHFIGISIPIIKPLRDSAERLLRTEQVVALLSLPAGYVSWHNAIGGILTIKLHHRAGRTYKIRTMNERANARLKDEFGGRTKRVRSASKVMAHLMFGILAITVDQLLRMARWWCQQFCVSLF